MNDGTPDVFGDKICPECLGILHDCKVCDGRGWVPLTDEEAAAIGAVPRPIR